MLDALYKPKTIAIIGASKNPLSIGHRVLANLRNHKFTGTIYPVNPKAKSIEGFRAYSSISEIPDEIDLANIAIPARFVPHAIEQCGRKGVKFAIVHSGGFRESGEEGAKWEMEMVDIAQKYGMRIYGPNSQGVMNSDPEVSLYANFTFTPMIPGNISILAQSGGIAESINLNLEEAGVGIRMYGSNGNACDITINELLEYFGQDEKTRLIILYVENFQDPERFVKIVSQITKHKPILAIKAGTSVEGARAITSHTGALMEKDTLSQVLFERAGILRFCRQEQLVQAAIAFSQLPLPKGNKIAIVTNAGGPGIQATDEAINQGLELSQLSDKTRNALKTKMSNIGSMENPVDLTATATPQEIGDVLDILLKAPEVDSLLLSMVTPFFVNNENVLEHVIKALQNSNKPAAISYLTNKKRWGHLITDARAAGIPVYHFSETASFALAAMSDYVNMQSRDRGAIVQFDHDREKASQLLREATRDDNGFIAFSEAINIIRCYGIPFVRTVRCDTLEDIEQNENLFHFPAVLKANIRGQVHKTEQGAVALAIPNHKSLITEAKKMQSYPGEIESFLVQPYIKGKREIIMGIKNSGAAGRLIMVGLGGIFTEIIRDVQFGLVPITRYDAGTMLRKLKWYSVLAGARGTKPVDFEAIENILLRLSLLAQNHPEIQELDLNPVLVSSEKQQNMVVDVRIK